LDIGPTPPTPENSSSTDIGTESPAARRHGRRYGVDPRPSCPPPSGSYAQGAAGHRARYRSALVVVTTATLALAAAGAVWVTVPSLDTSIAANTAGSAAGSGDPVSPAPGADPPPTVAERLSSGGSAAEPVSPENSAAFDALTGAAALARRTPPATALGRPPHTGISAAPPEPTPVPSAATSPAPAEDGGPAPAAPESASTSTALPKAKREAGSGGARKARVLSSGSCGASYYAEGQMTASGERFNPSALTAAHKTLPFGTRVRVTNAATGRSVIVRINDRGPFIGGRCLDLSRAAFASIGNTASGVLRVRYEVLAV
jgi:rare lipoprotein A